MFNNKVALVTGGASGIGKAAVLKFIEERASVVILDSNEATGALLADEICAAGGRARYVYCDVREENSIAAALDTAVSFYGRLDFAYNNAGIGGEFADIEHYPIEDWDKVMSINLRGVFLCMKYELLHLEKHKGSAIVNCASLLSTVAYENDSAYVASKFGVLGLTKNAALEYAKHGIRINAVSPGFTKTPMILSGDEEKLNKIASLHPIGRLANPEEIADAVIWLCSSKSSFAVGLNLIIDGGYTLV
jgi:NAD(P)-dependent dehydrogenase (short-subunit alcohol dehydrogenase family)